VKHIIRTSAGITSWAAGMRVADWYDRDGLCLVFADTLIEDEDSYRFLIEGSALVLGTPLDAVSDLAVAAMMLPPLEPGTPEFRAARLAERKAALTDLRERTTRVLPGLVWIADGRSPWEVFRAERFIGNSRIDPCSKLLKRVLLDRWVKANCTPDATHHFGLDWSEPARVTRFVAAMQPLRVECPMMEAPRFTKAELASDALRLGVAPPRLYAWGFPHGNCGGFCIKAGQAGAKRLLDTRRDYFLYNEQEESGLREHLGKDVSILRDRRGGKPRTLPLSVLRERLETTGLFDASDRGECSCFGTPEVRPC
jgi:hypothetical protein